MSSPPLRIDLRPSRLVRVALVVLTLLALAALWLSAVPPWGLLLPPVLLALAWRGADVPASGSIVLRADGSAVRVPLDAEEHALEPVRLQRRGPLTLLAWREAGRERVFLLTPEILTRAERRTLMLWFDRHAAPARTSGRVGHV